LIRYARERGAAVSVGHSLFTESDLDKASVAGASALTHLGNGLPNLIDRHRNPIWVGLADDRYTAMLITDGHHLPPSIIKTALRAKSAEHIIVVSDASALAGMPPGRCVIGGRDTVLEESGLLHIPSRNCMFGSSAVMMECMNYVAGLDPLDLDDLLAIGFYNPLRLIGVDPGVVPSDGQLLYNTETRTVSYSMAHNP
jgi:N-acetylglucosamine-6-phosphate deacetylase